MAPPRDNSFISHFKYIIAIIASIGIGLFLLYTEVVNFINGTIPNSGKSLNSVTKYAEEPVTFIIVISAASAFGVFLVLYGIWRLISYIVNNPNISED